VLALLVITLNAPQALRCFSLTGSPLGLPFPDGGPRFHWGVERITFRGTLANTIRNLSLHVFTPSEGINSHINRAVRWIIEKLGGDPDDPGTIWPGTEFQTNHFSLAEVHAGDPLHFAFLVFLLGAVVATGGRVLGRKAFWYAVGIVCSFVLFCAALRWQPWESRHHLPLFVLGSALMGLFLDRYFSKKAAVGMAAVFLLFAVPFALLNRTRSLIHWHRVDDVYHPRAVLYFNDQEETYAASAISAAQQVNHLNCDLVAFDSFQNKPDSQIVREPESFFVYPLFAMIHADGQTRTVWYTGVHNLTTRYEDKHPGAACAVVCLQCAGAAEKWSAYRPVGGRASVFGEIVVFSASGQIANTDATARALVAANAAR
jgi:hypothetical protein